MRDERIPEPSRWVFLLGIIGCVLVAHGLWIPTKAVLAQGLLESAWRKSVLDREPVPPWPWADTWPVARLRVMSHQIDQVILEGAGGSVLAFAPGRDALSQPTHTVIAGHRDTHFRFLEHMQVGDELELESLFGVVDRYRFAWSVVVDHRNLDVLESDVDALTLVTCWPFDAVVPGGPLRYVVRAELVKPVSVAFASSE